MDALYYAIGVVLFALALGVSIGLHELGHMIPAKKFGAKVTQYFVGFGPTVWSTRRGETEYGFKAIPLGGYVKIVGMLPPGAEQVAEDEGTDEDGTPVHRVRASNTGMFTQLISDARSAEWDLINEEDEPRLFYKKPWWKKAIVMTAGPAVNIVIAFGIFAGMFATYGNPNDLDISTTVDRVSPCVVPAEESGRACTPADPVTPAVKAGLQSGDRIVAFNGEHIDNWQELRSLVRHNGGGEATITLLRDGERITTTTSTTVTMRPTSGPSNELVKVGFLGVVPVVEPHTGGPLYTLVQMGDMTVRTLQALVTLPYEVFEVGKAVVGLEPREPDSPISVVGGGRLAGQVASAEAFDFAQKAVFLLTLIAGFNFFIGMFNFVPLLPLDGGHIAGALWEAVRRAAARLRGLPDPGHVDVAKLLPVAYVVGSVILVMGVVLIIGDIVVPKTI